MLFLAAGFSLRSTAFVSKATNHGPIAALLAQPDLAAESNCTSKSDFVHDAPAASSFAQTFMEKAPEDDLAQEVTDALEMNFNKIAPFGKEDTAKELQDHTAKTQDTLVDTVENAEVAEIKRATFRALTRLRAATIKEFDAIARLETQDIVAYNEPLVPAGRTWTAGAGGSDMNRWRRRAGRELLQSMLWGVLRGMNTTRVAR